MSKQRRKFTEPTDVHDSELRQEREILALPFTKSPFIHGKEVVARPFEDLGEGELRVRAACELPWSDLLLEVAMTTAFASLTDGTPILLASDAISYLSFFILVWWTWASQVAYNLRYRQADWLHRIWVFLQLFVFSGLAAFTRHFDITNGIADDTDRDLANKILLDLGSDESAVSALEFRDDRLPRLNARGVSITMALSRLLLLVQYVVVYYHARRLKRNALWVHIGSLSFSIVCYVVAFSILGNNDVAPSKAVEIVKVALWYLPLVVEVASHFVANVVPGRVRYPTAPVVARSGTVFIIILGGGLDKITSGFQDIVGNTTLGNSGFWLFLSAGVIFIATFSLYFGSSGGGVQLGSQRAMAWFFSHFFYLSAVIIMLQGIATSLSYSSVHLGIGQQFEATLPVLEWIVSHPGVNVTSSTFPDTKVFFERMGISFDSFIQQLNNGVTTAIAQNNSAIAKNTAIQLEVAILDNLLQKFDAEPDPGTLLSAKKLSILRSDPSNSTAINLRTFADVYGGILLWRGSSALWFYGAAGSTILALVLLSLIKGWPRDKWEWGSIISRLITGIVVIFLSLLSIGASKQPINPDLSPTTLRIWQIVNNDWLLPIFAILIGLLQITEYVLVHMANRSYFQFGGIQFWKTPTPYRDLPDGADQSLVMPKWRSLSSFTDPYHEPSHSDPYALRISPGAPLVPNRYVSVSPGGYEV